MFARQRGKILKNIIFKNKNGIQYIQFKKLLEYPEITHCYTMKNELNFRLQNQQIYNQSCEKILNAIQLKNVPVVRPYQTHTDVIEKIDRVKTVGELTNVDGVVTNKNQIALLTTSADCISMLLYDPVKKVIASVHSGWRGTLKAIILKAIKKMQNEYQSNPKDIICCICPSIRQCCFEVDEDVKNLFYEKYKYLSNINEIIKTGEIKEGKQKYCIDTVKINIQLLKNIGLKPENIIDSEICTMCNSNEFHSYRAEGKSFGVNAAIISLQ